MEHLGYFLYGVAAGVGATTFVIAWLREEFRNGGRK